MATLVEPRTTDWSQLVSQFLTTSGASGGSADGAVNGSSTPVLLKISPPDQGGIAISQLVLTLRDAGTFTADTYGAGSALTNGIAVGTFDADTGDLVTAYTVGGPVKTNSGWDAFGVDVAMKSWGGGEDYLVARWEFPRAGTLPLITATNNLAFGVLISDDLTGLDLHRFQVQGFHMRT